MRIPTALALLGEDGEQRPRVRKQIMLRIQGKTLTGRGLYRTVVEVSVVFKEQQQQ